MAYQNVGNPRFFVNNIEWLRTKGAITFNGYTWNPSLWNTLPITPAFYRSNIYAYNNNNHPTQFDLEFPAGIFSHFSFIAMLGHNFHLTDYGFHLRDQDGMDPGEGIEGVDSDGIARQVINMPWHSPIEYGGFSIGTFIGSDTTKLIILPAGDDGGDVGSIIVGTYYTMPHSPELNITMTREQDGAKRLRTRGGADLVSYSHVKSNMWGLAAAWELYSGINSTQLLGRSGRRTWDLSWNHVRASDLFGSNQTLGTYEWGSQDPAIYGGFWAPSASGDEDLAQSVHPPEGDPNHPTVNNAFAYTILTDYNFYSQVIHKTNGGALPFIFQPDSNNANADGWAIAKLDMKSFKFEQVANGLYNVKLKIREVW